MGIDFLHRTFQFSGISSEKLNNDIDLSSHPVYHMCDIRFNFLNSDPGTSLTVAQALARKAPHCGFDSIAWQRFIGTNCSPK
jgi:hypothetical protein